MVLDGIAPRRVWGIFEEVFASTPRPSNHETRIRERIIEWARSQQASNITCATDRAGNLLLKLAATPQCRGWAPVLLQGHMDMVCETSRPSGFDFEHLPIPVRIDPDGAWISADGTTLGADDGIGASIALALLVDEDLALSHGPIEVLLTCAEETGLDGAYQLDTARLGIEGRYLFNVDSEELGIITIGSAGGGGVRLEAVLDPIPPAETHGLAWFEISITGLRGGHSGVDIHLPRANAIKLTARVLAAVQARLPIMLSSWEGGTRHNAIPRASSVKFATSTSDAKALLDLVAKEAATVEAYYKGKSASGDVLEPEIRIELKQVAEAQCASARRSAEIVCVVDALPCGPVRFSPEMPALVETSSNVATLSASTASGHLDLFVSVRSNLDSELVSFTRSIAAIGRLASWSVTLDDPYPAWTPDPGSAFLAFVKSRYEKRLGNRVDVRSVHAGLECSVLARRIPSLANNIVSIGPEVQNAHTPAERARIGDVQVLYDILKDILSSANQLP